MKTPLAAEKFLVECVEPTLDKDSSDSHIPIAGKYHNSIIRNILLDGNMHPRASTLYINDPINN